MDSPSKERESKPHLSHHPNLENLLEAEASSHLENRSGNRAGRFDLSLESNHQKRDFLSERSRPRPPVPARHSVHKEREWTDIDDPLLNARNHVNEDVDEQRRDRQIALERSALMMDLRKRRLTDHNEDRLRRSSGGSLSFRPMMVEQRKDISRLGNLNSLSNSPIAKPPGSGTMESSLLQRHSRGSLRSRRSREISLPRWQPDAEVSNCPICGAAFGFWYRKHHCRKCGRVVCANCSPHRITIPRQFIVQPPQDTSSSQSPFQRGIPVLDLTGDDQVDSSATDSLGHHQTANPKNQRLQIDPALGGGQEVRLCNPCVPDPNPLPHVAFGSSPPFSLDSNSAPENVDRASDLSTQQQPGVSSRQPFSIQQDYDSRNKSFEFLSNQLLRSGTITSSNLRHGDPARASNSSRYFPRSFSSAFSSAPDTSLHDRFLDSLQTQHRLPQSHHRHHSSASVIPSNSQHHDSSRIPSSVPPRAAHHAQPQLREEDQCPVCHNALPPRGIDGSETGRETHIAACIETSLSSAVPSTLQLAPRAVAEAAMTANESIAGQAGGSNAILEGSRRAWQTPGRGDGAFETIGNSRQRVRGMVVYQATEKDCVGEDGAGQAECVICFEEFEAGVDMGRLECLCKFHKACIRKWWDKKGVGACPVHQGDMS